MFDLQKTRTQLARFLVSTSVGEHPISHGTDQARIAAIIQAFAPLLEQGRLSALTEARCRANRRIWGVPQDRELVRHFHLLRQAIWRYVAAAADFRQDPQVVELIALLKQANQVLVLDPKRRTMLPLGGTGSYAAMYVEIMLAAIARAQAANPTELAA